MFFLNLRLIASSCHVAGFCGSTLSLRSLHHFKKGGDVCMLDSRYTPMTITSHGSGNHPVGTGGSSSARG